MKRKPIGPRARAELIAAAKKAQLHAICPYSHYAVGAAVLGGSGKVYAGANVESPTLISHVCAERAAIFHALSHGETRIKAVCTVSKASEPCGTCRQAIREFGDGDTPIISLHLDGKSVKILDTTISRLLPHAHTKELLEEARGSQ